MYILVDNKLLRYQIQGTNFKCLFLHKHNSKDIVTCNHKLMNMSTYT